MRNDPQLTPLTLAITPDPKPACRGCYSGIDPASGARVLECYRWWWFMEPCRCGRCVTKRGLLA